MKIILLSLKVWKMQATGGRVDRVSQFMQKRRRHTEAGWKTLQGKT